MKVVAIPTPEVGDRTYLATDDDVAVVVDPQRDVGRVIEAAARLGARITHVLETHVHNDYVSGGLELSRACGAIYVLARAEPVRFESERMGVVDGDEILTGSLRVRVIHTPGHTPHHLAYAVSDRADRASVVFTGGSMLFGTAGRTDLSGADHTNGLARAQWRSLRRLVEELPPDTHVHPTHGFGSFCAATDPDRRDESTIGVERTANPALTLDEEAFSSLLVSGFESYPAYYAHMAVLNRAGPPPLDLTPPPEIGAVEAAQRARDGELVLDLRPRRSFASAHLPGTVGVEAGPGLVTQVGWTFPWSAPLTLLGTGAEQVAEVQLGLARIGIDCLAAWAVAAGGTSSYPVAGFADLARAVEGGGDIVVLDVRRDEEWAAGHLRRSRHVPLHELTDRAAEVPLAGTVWVHCGAGFRASIAASLLHRAGHDVVLVDDAWESASLASLEIVGERVASTAGRGR